MVEYVKALYELFRTDEEEGQGLVEYALILVLISVVAILVMTQVGDAVTNVFQAIADALAI